MIIKSGFNGDGKMKTKRIFHAGHKCLSFWYYLAILGYTTVNGVTLKVLHNGNDYRTIDFTADGNWHFYDISIYIGMGDYISFQAIFGDNNNTFIGIDDVSLSVIYNGLSNCETCKLLYLYLEKYIIMCRLQAVKTAIVTHDASFMKKCYIHRHYVLFT